MLKTTNIQIYTMTKLENLHFIGNIRAHCKFSEDSFVDIIETPTETLFRVFPQLQKFSAVFAYTPLVRPTVPDTLPSEFPTLRMYAEQIQPEK